MNRECIAAAFIVFALSVGDAQEAQPAHSAIASSEYTHAQQLIPVDRSRRLNLFCLGNGEPAVLLDAGSGGTTLDWRHVQGSIAKFTRVCAYDRAGLGFSDPAKRPSDIYNTVDDVHRLLQAAGINKPIIYVGHSVAALYELAFEAAYPQKVAGAVFVDPAFPNVFDNLLQTLPPSDRAKERGVFSQMISAQAACEELAQKGELVHPVTQDEKQCVDTSAYPDKLDARLQLALAREMASASANSVGVSSSEAAFPISSSPSLNDVEIDKVHPNFGNKPLVVLTEGNGEPLPAPTPTEQAAMTAEWRAGQKVLSRLSTRGVDVIVPNTGHYIQIDQPAAVTDAVRQVVLDVRGRT